MAMRSIAADIDPGLIADCDWCTPAISRFARSGNALVKTRFTRPLGPFRTLATAKSQPKLPRYDSRIGVIPAR